MAQLAVSLCEMGFVVSGSDKEFYEPMGSLLARSAVRICRGFDAANLASDVNLVVIGNAVSYGNPEVLAVEKRALAYTLFPRLLYDTVIAGRHSIVVSGTHGKTTTSAMGAFVLSRLGMDPGYFIGGIAHDLEQSLRRGNGKVSIVEGDEYDSAFFAKVPKFTFYAPDTLIITSVEFDHADIYPDLESINAQFSALVTSRKKDGYVIACADDLNLKDLVASWRGQACCPLITYGEAPTADWRLSEVHEQGEFQSAVVRGPNGECFTLSLRLPGTYNLKNALSVLLALEHAGAPRSGILTALKEFRGVRRRQELRADAGGIVVIEDFAHHPTAVRETLNGLRARFPQRRLLAVFEPRSATSRRRVFQEQYVEAFSSAGEAILCRVAARSLDQDQALLDVDELAQAIAASGVPARALPDATQIAEYLRTAMRRGDVMVIMSNGSFGGLIDTLVKMVTEIARL